VRLCTLTCIHDDNEFLEVSLKSTSRFDHLVVVNRVSWNGEPRGWKQSVEIAERMGATVEIGEWKTEEEHRKASIQIARDAGFTHAIIQDSDEIYEPGLLDHLNQIAEADLADRVYCHWDTYWKTPEFVIRPREPFCPCVLINLDRAEYLKLREFGGGRLLLLESTYGIIHHLSYVGSDERIWRKITSWSHRDEVQRGWWERTWKGWDRDKMTRNLHPTHPKSYQFAEKTGAHSAFFPKALDPRPELPEPWPTISVCIPLYGAEGAFRICVDSLEKCRDLLHEVIVVDNASKDQAASVAAQHEWITLIRNDENRGFAKGSNQAYEASSGEVVLFLNSDAIVTRAGLVELIRALNTHSNVAAAAPLTNFACTEQMIEPCLSSLEQVEGFAEVVAERWTDDTETDFAIGFCFAVKRSVLEEHGAFDERFQLGGAEDAEICYRFRREGYRILVAQKSYIHHLGSQTFAEVQFSHNLRSLAWKNDQAFYKKWHRDVECGFASHLSGQSSRRIVFDESRRPPRVGLVSAEAVREADIALCMIVKNEESSLQECLESAKPFFTQMCVLDTGSTDRTVEIARQCGATVRIWEWQDSFAAARTESMQGVLNKWIMWLDADDTLPEHCGREIVEAVLSAPQDVIAFVVPVRFVEERGHGVQVDHVKVFRNFPGLQWEGHIHEQILPSLRLAASKAGITEGGRLGRLNAFVLHSNYDTSPAGQARKRARDSKLLQLDLAERPDHPFVHFNIGMTAHYMGEFEIAIDALRKSIELAAPNESHVRKSYALWGQSLRSLGRDDEARACLEQGLQAVGADPEIEFYLAQLDSAQQDHMSAIQRYESVLKANLSNTFSSVDQGILGYKTLHNLAAEHWAMGDYSAAKSRWEQSLSDQFMPEIVVMYAQAALSQGDFEAVKYLLSQAIRLRDYVSWIPVHSIVMQKFGLSPIPGIQHELESAPHDSHLRLSLAQSLLEEGRKDQAVPHLLWLDQQDLPHGAYFLALLSDEQGDIPKARAWVARAAALNPDHEGTKELQQKLGH